MMSVFSFARIYYILKQYFSSTMFMSLKMRRIVQLFSGEEVDLYFSLKCYILTRPYQFLIMSFLSSMIIFPFIIMTFERPIAAISNNKQLENWDDTIWFSVITMTTSKSFFLQKLLIFSHNKHVHKHLRMLTGVQSDMETEHPLPSQLESQFFF